MGLFGKNHNIYKDNDKELARANPRRPGPKSCTTCHGTGERFNGTGRADGRRCKSCKGSGLR